MLAASSLRGAVLRSAGACALVTVAVAAVLGDVVQFPFIAFDDAEFIVRNPQVSAPGESWREMPLTPAVGYIVPVTVAFEALLFRLSGGEPWSFHLAALLLHALYCAQLHHLARRLGAPAPAALGAALVFALHPLVVQPVSWAVCLKDLLMGNLVLAATGSFLRIRSGPGRAAAWTCAALALLAMLAKPSAVLVGIAWLAALRARALTGEKVPAPALRAALFVTAAGVLLGAASRHAHRVELGESNLASWTILTPFLALGRQLFHVVWPTDLFILYPDHAEVPAPMLVAAGVAGACALAWLLRRLRARPAPLLLLALALATYLPTSNLVPFARFMSDSYMYVPLSALCVGAALGLARVLERRPAWRPAALGAAGVLAALLALSSRAQLDRWRGGRHLWEPVVRAYPGLFKAHVLMGEELFFREDHAGAAEAYERAFRLSYDERYLTKFGTILAVAGRLADAECVLIEAVAFAPSRAYALHNLATLMAREPGYRPSNPEIVRTLLCSFEEQERSGGPALDPTLRPGLEAAIQNLGGSGARSARIRWPRRNCSALRPPGWSPPPGEKEPPPPAGGMTAPIEAGFRRLARHR